MMRKILVSVILLVSFYAKGQYPPTATKTKFVNGIALGTKDTNTLKNAGDTINLTVSPDSTLRFRYKGFYRPLTFSGGNDYIRNQFGSTLAAQTGKFWVDDTIKTTGKIISNANISVSDSALVGYYRNIISGGTISANNFSISPSYNIGYGTNLTTLATAIRAVNFPDAAGTVALTSDITGGTLAASFTTGTFSGNLTVKSIRINRGLADDVGTVSIGELSLNSITSGINNVGIGYASLQRGTTTTGNTAVGTNSLSFNISGASNTAIGNSSLLLTTGASNTALGASSGIGLTTGSNNTIIGQSSGGGVTTGSNNTILGASVTGLASGLTGNIILANGAGSIKAQHDGTNWALTGDVSMSGLSATTGTFSGIITGSVNGNIFGTSSATGWGLTVNSGSGALGARIIGRNNAGTDEGFLAFYRLDGTTLQGSISGRTSSLYFRDGTNTDVLTLTGGAATFSGSVTATDYRISALNTAPATASSTGTTGEIRYVNGFIYVCAATNTWQRVAIATW